MGLTAEEYEFLLTQFTKLDIDSSGKITPQELRNGLSGIHTKSILQMVEEADADGDGHIDILEFINMMKSKVSVGTPTPPAVNPELEANTTKLFTLMDANGNGYVVLRELERHLSMAGIHLAKDRVSQLYDMIRGVTTTTTSKSAMVDFADLPPLVPRHAVIKNCYWIDGDGGKPGSLTFPADFDGRIPVDIATSETVGYYGAAIAETMKSNNAKSTIYLDTRHAIEDFTYAQDYFQQWVMGQAGGPGLEYHQFHHLDMPLAQNSGHWVLAKWANEEETELHITAFQVPVRHTMYTPGGVLHTNNYLKGTWRTMLSDGPITEAKQFRGRQPFGFTIAADME